MASRGGKQIRLKSGLGRRTRWGRFIAFGISIRLARIVWRHDARRLVSRSLLELLFFFLLFRELFLTLLESVVGCRQGSSLNQVLTQYRNLKGNSINPLFGRIASLWGARNPHVPGRTFRSLRAPRLALHPEQRISRSALNPVAKLVARRAQFMLGTLP